MSDSRKRHEALLYHAKPKPGKIEVVPTKKYATQHDLALAYSPRKQVDEIKFRAACCSEKLRAQQSSCHMIIVMLRSDRYKKNASLRNTKRLESV